MNNRILIFLAGLLMLTGTACSKKADQSAQAASVLYHCAMHPQIISDKPGECPICHMRLIPFTSGAPTPAAPRKILFYRNPMNPSATSPVPMKDAMGMAYVPVYEDQGTAQSAVAGLSTVRLTPEIEQRIGVVVTPATMQDLAVPIRAAARVAYDPQLYSAALEHQEALKFLQKAKAQSSADLVDQAESTVRSSELRLRQMGLSESQIEEIASPGYDPADLILGSKRGALWIYASIFDYDAPLIHSGQEAEISSPALPGKTYEGKVYSIDPVLSNETRTLRARIRIARTDGALRPEMYVSALIHAGVGRHLAVPQSAIMDTGTRQIVYAQTAPGTYEPREVKVGHRAGDQVEILDGLKEGEKVVTAANFLIDSESRIQAATQQAVEGK